MTNIVVRLNADNVTTSQTETMILIERGITGARVINIQAIFPDDNGKYKHDYLISLVGDIDSAVEALNKLPNVICVYEVRGDHRTFQHD